MLESMNERILPSANKSRDPKKIKQHPTVSTGYVMRIMTIQEEIHKFCAAQTSTFNVLILGCGLDPLGRWIEITFPSVGVVYEMDCKEIVEEKRRAYDRVGWGVEGILDGCDFDREAEVKACLSSTPFSPNIPTLIVSEVVLSYVSSKFSLLSTLLKRFGPLRTTLVAYETLIPNEGARKLYQNAYEERFGEKLARGGGGKEEVGGGGLKTWRDSHEIREMMKCLFGEGTVTHVTPACERKIKVPSPTMFDEHTDLALYLGCYVVVRASVSREPSIVEWGEFIRTMGEDGRRTTRWIIEDLYERVYGKYSKQWGSVRRMVWNAVRKDFKDVAGAFQSFMCLVHGGEARGFCGVKKVGENDWEVSRFVIDEGYRGKGWGRKLLMATVLNALQQHPENSATVRAKTIVACEEAIGLYKAIGWKEYGREEGEVDIISFFSHFTKGPKSWDGGEGTEGAEETMAATAKATKATKSKSEEERPKKATSPPPQAAPMAPETTTLHLDAPVSPKAPSSPSLRPDAKSSLTLSPSLTE